jgi:hypothetical protein
MAEEQREKRAYVRRAPLNTPEINRQRRAEFAASQPPLVDRDEPGSSAPTTRSVSVSDIRTEDELKSEAARNDFNSNLVDSYSAGTLAETHPQWDTVNIRDVPSQKVSESDENYNKKLGKNPEGAIWARAMALPSTIVSQHGIHFHRGDFQKHWGAPTGHIRALVARNPSVGVRPVTGEDYARINGPVATESESSNSWEDSNGTATGETG